MTAGRARVLVMSVATTLLVGGVATDPSDALGRRGTATPTADGGGFYAAPSPLPEGEPGAVVRAEPIASPDGAQAWRVLYHSRDVAGDDIVVSGIVVAPAGGAPSGRRPVVAWAHPTTGLGDRCAPSRRASAASEIPWIDELIDAGYVVAATDYAGLGTDGVHPYLVGVSEGRAVLDSIRAARALPVRAGTKAVVVGHSQGGHAALFAGEIARRDAPELSLRGVAAGAPVASPQDLIDRSVAEQRNIGFLVMGALGYQAAYPELADMSLLTAVGAPGTATVLDGCASDVMAAYAGVDPSVVFGVDPSTVPEWTRRLEENDAGRRRSSAPVLYWQGADDDLTVAASADAYAARACRRGTRLTLRVYPGADHVTVIAAAHPDVIAFVDDVLTGARPEGSCPRSGR